MPKVIIKTKITKSYPFKTEKQALDFIVNNKYQLGEYEKITTPKGFIWLGNVSIEYEEDEND